MSSSIPVKQLGVQVGTNSITGLEGQIDKYWGTNGTGVEGAYSLPEITYPYTLLTGAVGDGVTDDTTAITTAITATPTGGKLVFPAGKTFLVTNIPIGKSLTIEGNGSQLKTVSNNDVITIGAHDVKINFLNFSGSGKSSGLTSQNGVNCTAFLRNILIGCKFENFGNAGYKCATTSTNSYGGQLLGCEFYSNKYGFFGSTTGEFYELIGCKAIQNTTGIHYVAGNTTIIGCNINRNQDGLVVEDGSNDGHGIVQGCNINHNTGSALKINGIALGHTLMGIHIYDGAVTITGSTGIKIIGGNIAAASYVYTNSNVKWIGMTFITDYVGNQTETTSDVEYCDCHALDGRVAINPNTFMDVKYGKYYRNLATEPTTSPTGGHFVYSFGGTLKSISSSGTKTLIAAL